MYEIIMKDIRAHKKFIIAYISILLVVAVFASPFFGFGGTKLPDWYTIVSLVPLLPVIFTLPFVYPLLARFSNGIKGTLTNSYTLCMINFPKFLLIWLIFIVALAVSICFPPAALVTPAVAMYLTQMITEKAFEKAIEVEKAREEKADGSEVAVDG